MTKRFVAETRSLIDSPKTAQPWRPTLRSDSLQYHGHRKMTKMGKTFRRFPKLRAFSKGTLRIRLLCFRS